MTLGRDSGAHAGTRLRILLSLALLIAALSSLVTPSTAAAAVQVSSLADDGSAGTLRVAIAGATAGDTITFAANVTGTIVLTDGPLNIDKNLTIDGPGAAVLSVSADNWRGVIEVNRGVTATIDGLTITDGNSTTGYGGGIYNARDMMLTNSTVSGNSAPHGGGISNVGWLTITNSTVSSNSAGSGGGGIYNYASTMTLTSSTISGNTAAGGGNGIFNSSAMTLSSTILANPGGNCSGSTGTDNGYNLASDSSCAFNAGTSLSSANPKLYPGGPQNNGGPTRTIGLRSGSPAIDAIPVASCRDANGNTLTTDQRGEPRPNGVACDIGAFEGSLVAPPDTTAPVVTVPGNQTLDATSSAGAAYTYTATAEDAYDGTVSVSCDPASGSTFPLGTTTVTCTATDEAANPGSASFTVTVEDITAPVVQSPKIAATTGSAPNGTLLVRLTWSGTDDIGVTGYRLQSQTNGGAWVPQYVPGTATSKVLRVTAADTVRMQVRAVDAAGNLGVWKLSAPFATSVIEAHDDAVIYSSGWTNGTIGNSIDGLVRKSSTASAIATVPFQGSSISWVSARNPMRGKAVVSIDGVYIATIDLYRATNSAPTVVFAYNGLNPGGNHSLRIRVLGQGNALSDGTAVVIDHFIVAGPVR